MHATDDHAEADRIMTVCNSCRYCEGLCAVFPAMELRRSFPDGDLDYLANLCHGCGACYYDCQFSPPHEFNVDVPRIFARLRARSYARYAWPGAFSFLFARNGRAVSAAAAIFVVLFLAGFALLDGPSFLAPHEGAGAFYALMPHAAMVAVFGVAFVAACAALGAGLAKFWRATAAGPQEPATSRLLRAVRDAAELRYLDGGGSGCMNEGEQPTDRRALFHHFTFYGFLLCFAATCVATLDHYTLGWEAPYPWYGIPVLLGTVGGVGLVVGPAGLLAAKLRRDPELREPDTLGMDMAFVAMLLLVGASGLALLFLRATAAMGPLLAIHLGLVLALFVTMPYGKFVHGLYRFAALVRYARETEPS
ncbi:MAG TPA: tricarballylate utilization 4Fe-4S protein TcuB [Acetobacteraceae bacterium]|jgi:citrate/tricarballylate utilization protein|nr:tricarballylate utilization 4Fe-4S protein TcuB [Acetobacteraceae bacterium]